MSIVKSICVINKVPVFGTEEALVEPILLALDTMLPFLEVSAKKPRKQNNNHENNLKDSYGHLHHIF